MPVVKQGDQKISVHTLIVGQGPAGLALAILLKRAGFSVAVLDVRERFSRSQVVGLPYGMLERLMPRDIHQAFMDKTRASFLAEKGRLVFRSKILKGHLSKVYKETCLTMVYYIRLRVLNFNLIIVHLIVNGLPFLIQKTKQLLRWHSHIWSWHLELSPNFIGKDVKTIDHPKACWLSSLQAAGVDVRVQESERPLYFREGVSLNLRGLKLVKKPWSHFLSHSCQKN